MNPSSATRQADFTPTSISPENRTIDVVWSTGAPVKRMDFWTGNYFTEELNITGANLERLNAGASVLDSHTRESLRNVIGVVQKAWIDLETKHGMATLKFSDREEVFPIWRDIQQGIIRHVSIGYTIDESRLVPADKKNSPDTLIVERFTPNEISLVSVPADAGAHVRSLSIGHTMSEETKDNTTDSGLLRREFTRAKQLGRQEAVSDERKRIRSIDEIFQMDIVPRDDFYQAMRTRAIDDGWQPDQTRQRILEAMSEMAEPVFERTEKVVRDEDMGIQQRQVGTRQQTAKQPGRIELKRDGLEALREGAGNAIFLRCLHSCGYTVDPAIAENVRETQFGDLSCIELGRSYFERTGVKVGRDRNSLVSAMFTRGAGPMTASDFSGILANVATKIAQKGYTEAPTTYQDWANVAYLPDFKPATIPGLGSFSDLDQIPAGGAPYFYGTFGDVYETAQLGTYGKLFGIPRTAILNDDLMFFTRVGTSMGQAAARKVNAIAYAVLTGNQVLTEDNTAIFHANHSNFVAQGAGAAPSVTTLNAAEVAMALQTSPKQSADTSTVYLNVAPGHLLVPFSLKATAEVLNTATYDPAGTTASVSRRDAPNPWRGRLTVTADAALGGSTATGWYLLAPRGSSVVDTVTVFFLEGSNGEPYVREQEGFDSDGVQYKVRIDAVARAITFRGAYYNFGA